MLAALVAVAAPAQAQLGTVERNLPPAVTGARAELSPGVTLPVTEDDSPLGVDLSGIRLLDIAGEVQDVPDRGISVADVDGVQPEYLEKALSSFVGKPLSRRLIGEIQATVANVYRNAGRPFVAVTPPPQDISDGVLQLRVIPFRLGAVSARVADGSPAASQDAALAARLRAEQGELIDAPRLSEDLDWLNRYPYRNINGVFEPGTRPGDSNLMLDITRQKPWQVFAGWSNSGTRETDYSRYFVGFGVGLERLNDAAVSYQMTGSGNFWSDPSGVMLSGAKRPSYLNHAARVTIPTFHRQAIEITPSFVATSQSAFGDLLTFRNTTFELPILYRSAVSNIAPDLAGWGDLYGGAAPRWVERDALFEGVKVANGKAGVFDIILGWTNQFQRWGTTNIDVRVVANPGRVVGGNEGATWQSFTNGRVTGAQYVYAYGSAEQVTSLSGLSQRLEGFTLRNTLYAQVAGQALPDTEQIALGGYYATRGYTLSDGSVDAGFVLRNELRAPTMPLLARPGVHTPLAKGTTDAVSPFLFVDVAYGHNFGFDGVFAAFDPDITLVGAGVGVDYALGRSLQAGLVAGVALTNGPFTDRGDITVQGRVVVTY